MNDFNIIESHLAKIKELRGQVEGIEKSNFNNVKNRTIIDKNIEISTSSESTVEERCKSINLLYLVCQKKFIREIIQDLNPTKIKVLVKRMICNPPIGNSIEKMACNRNIWIDESVWQLSKVLSRKTGANKGTDAGTALEELDTTIDDTGGGDENLSEILESLNNYKYHLSSSLQLSGALNLVIGMLDHSSTEGHPSSGQSQQS